MYRGLKRHYRFIKFSEDKFFDDCRENYFKITAVKVLDHSKR